MRPMRLSKREVRDTARIREIIEGCHVLRIGATDAEGMFIVPVNFGYAWSDDEALPHFYIHSAREGRKADAFRAGGDDGTPVALELDIDRGSITGTYSCAWSRSYASIMGTGTVREVTDEGQRVRALELLMAHAAPGAEASFTPDGMARVAIFRIDVAHLSAKERAPQEHRGPAVEKSRSR